MINKKGGFSLVELLIVVAIIGTLAAIGVPAYQSYQKKARRSTCTAMLNSCYKAQTLYVGENDAYSRYFYTGANSLDPNREIFPPTSQRKWYDFGLSAEGGAIIDTNGSGELNYLNHLASSGASTTGNPNYISSSFVPTAGTMQFNCVCRGNIDGDNVIDLVRLNQDNTTTIVTNDI